MESYTIEQARKAIRQKQESDMRKYIALGQREQAVQWVWDLFLPYRIALDYIKGSGDQTHVRLNKWYPMPCEPIEAAPLPWDMKTDSGKEAWKKYFTLYLIPYKDVIGSWSSFDMFGDTNHTPEEIEGRKAFYMNAIRSYEADQEGRFDHEPRRKQVDDYLKYDFLVPVPLPFQGFYMWDGENVPEHPEALQIMLNERDICMRLERPDDGMRKKIDEIIETIKHKG